jgi:hypothetical protein
MIKNTDTIFLIITLLMLQSCQDSIYKYAENWSTEVKRKIIEDSNIEPDKTIFDTSSNNLTLFKEDKKLKFYHLVPTFDSNSKVTFYDTAVCIFYSSDQNFELVRELCSVSDRRFEGIKYKGNHLGLAEFKYCDGNIKERGFRYNNKEVGKWTKFDSTGKVMEETDNSNLEQLKNLKDIKYYR